MDFCGFMAVGLKEASGGPEPCPHLRRLYYMPILTFYVFRPTRALALTVKESNWDLAGSLSRVPIFIWIAGPQDFKVAFKLMVGPAKALETGHPFLASSACS